MEILKICIFSIICAIAVVALKEYNKNVATLITIAGGILIVALVFDEYSGILSRLINFVKNSGFSVEHVSVIFKIVTIGYIAQITVDILEELEIKSLSSKVAFSAKITMLLLCLPIVLDLFNLICEVL